MLFAVAGVDANLARSYRLLAQEILQHRLPLQINQRPSLLETSSLITTSVFRIPRSHQRRSLSQYRLARYEIYVATSGHDGSIFEYRKWEGETNVGIDVDAIRRRRAHSTRWSQGRSYELHQHVSSSTIASRNRERTFFPHFAVLFYSHQSHTQKQYDIPQYLSTRRPQQPRRSHQSNECRNHRTHPSSKSYSTSSTSRIGRLSQGRVCITISYRTVRFARHLSSSSLFYYCSLIVCLHSVA